VRLYYDAVSTQCRRAKREAGGRIGGPYRASSTYALMLLLNAIPAAYRGTNNCKWHSHAVYVRKIAFICELVGQFVRKPRFYCAPTQPR